MKKLVWLGFCAGLVLPVCAQGVKPAPGAVESKPVAVVEGVKPSPKALNFDAGADLRIRQEVLINMPNPAGAATKSRATQNYIRYRPRVWGQVKNEDFKLYMRVTDEMRSYSTPDSGNYRWPDELFIDNLYLDLYNLFDGLVDIRAGRQDFFGPTGPMYGAGRVLCDGTPGDGSRTLYMDAIKATIKFNEKNTLDLLGIYNSPENQFNLGHSDGLPAGTAERQLTGGPGEAEYGGGLYFRSKEVAEVPFELYYFYKRETRSITARTSGTAGGAVPEGRETHTVGGRVMPKLTETLSAEFEGAAQKGEKDGGARTAGFMGYGGLTYKPLVDSTAKPYFTGALYYLSGDKDQGAGQSDASWDPLWARWPQFSELYAYNTIYGAGYWSNLVYPHAAAGVDFAPGHKLSSSLGPMYTAVEDDLGGGGGNLRGWLGMVRYDFPLVKNIFGLASKRGELYGHVTAEVLEPGDYYASDKTAFFLRWEINAKF